MMRRFFATSIAACVLFFAPIGAHSQTSTAQTSATKPDSVLFTQAMNAMNNAEYAVARTQLKTLLTTYQSSRYVPQAKLAMADAWFADGNLPQAKMEYQDFVTFFPKRPEVAQAQTRLDWIQRAIQSSR
jgi:outer membrane protein assembly factor BamD